MVSPFLGKQVPCIFPARFRSFFCIIAMETAKLNLIFMGSINNNEYDINVLCDGDVGVQRSLFSNYKMLLSTPTSGLKRCRATGVRYSLTMLSGLMELAMSVWDVAVLSRPPFASNEWSVRHSCAAACTCFGREFASNAKHINFILSLSLHLTRRLMES